MKTDPRYGYFPRWPEDGFAWIHPEDVDTARDMLPGNRIWKRDGADGPFAKLYYGDVRIRVKHRLWNVVKPEGIDIGHVVEVRSRLMRNTYRICKVRDMFWDAYTSSIRYRVENHGQTIPKLYARSDLRPLPPMPKSYRARTRNILPDEDAFSTDSDFELR